MVIDLLNYIAAEIKSRNDYFNNYVGVAFQLEDGRVYKFTTSDEKIYCGLSDADGVGFYVKINPIVSFTQGRNITSIKKVSEATIECNLIAYQFDSDINIINWLSKLTEGLQSINLSDYGGDLKHLKIEIVNVNISAQQIFKEETNKDLENDSLKAISIKYNVKFTSNKFDCLDCSIFQINYC